MKQKYKVFINDKAIHFQASDEPVKTGSTLLDAHYSSHKIAYLVNESTFDNTKNFIIQGSNPDKQLEKFIADFPKISAAGGIVRHYNLQGDILMIFRNGRWDLPKGKVDAGESLKAAALREVREECGINDLKIVEKLADSIHLYELKGKWVVKFTNWYLMLSGDQSELTPQKEEGITDVKWVNEKDVYYLLQNTYASISDLLLTTILKS